jgi:hypothetical protein
MRSPSTPVTRASQRWARSSFTGRRKRDVVSSVTANFPAMAIVAHAIASSRIDSSTPPCTKRGAPENRSPSSNSHTTASSSSSCSNGNRMPPSFLGSHT